MSVQGPGMTYTVDAGAAGAVFVSLMGWLPPVVALTASVMAVAWYTLQFWESRTLQDYMQKRTQRKIMRLTAKLAALQLHSDAAAAANEIKATAKTVAKELKKQVDAPIPTYPGT